jgi:GNAT superfamily N-acetyltransferase
MSREDGRTDHHELIWELFVEGALRYRSSWILGNGSAVSVWIPPGGSEMSDEQENRLLECVKASLGPRAIRFNEVLRLMGEAHPRSVDHYYLSLLGTDPDHRGQGLGMKLLDHDLATIDLQSCPAYLESSNPANNERYKRVGFEIVGSFQAPDGGPLVTTMWRSAR